MFTKGAETSVFELLPGCCRDDQCAGVLKWSALLAPTLWCLVAGVRVAALTSGPLGGYIAPGLSGSLAWAGSSGLVCSGIAFQTLWPVLSWVGEQNCRLVCKCRKLRILLVPIFLQLLQPRFPDVNCSSIFDQGWAWCVVCQSCAISFISFSECLKIMNEKKNCSFNCAVEAGVDIKNKCLLKVLPQSRKSLFWGKKNSIEKVIAVACQVLRSSWGDMAIAVIVVAFSTVQLAGSCWDSMSPVKISSNLSDLPC